MSMYTVCQFGFSCYSGPLGHLWLPCHLGPCTISDPRVILGSMPSWASAPSRTFGSPWASMASCALCHHVGLPCHLPSWTLGSSWASKPSCALRHLIPSGHLRSLHHLRPSDSPQPDALSRRWDVYPKGGISESFGTPNSLILGSREP